MLCPNAHKIMPVGVDCQAFGGNFSNDFYLNFSMSYKMFRSKSFKNMGKKMALS